MDELDELYDRLKKVPLSDLITLFDNKFGNGDHGDASDHEEFLKRHGWQYDEFAFAIRTVIIR